MLKVMTEKEWADRRKRIWDEKKNNLSPHWSRTKIKLMKEYFLSGAVYESQVHHRDKLEPELRFYLKPMRTEAELDGAIDEYLVAEKHPVKLIALLLQASADYSYSEFGFMDGFECLALKKVLPVRFDNALYQKEVNERYEGGARYLSPSGAWFIMIKTGGRFLSGFSCNPYNPLQEFIEYFCSAVPYFHFGWKADNSISAWPDYDAKPEYIKDTLHFMQLIRNFHEPRGLPGEDTPAKRFRDRLFEFFESGAAGEDLNQLWAYSATEEGSKPVYNYGDWCERVVFYTKQKPALMRELVDAYHQQGYCEPFDANAIQLVDLKYRLSGLMARALGYSAVPDSYGYPAGVSISAFYYKVNLNEAALPHTVGVSLSLQLFFLGLQSKSEFNDKLPQIIIIPTYQNESENKIAIAVSFIERQLYRKLLRDKKIVAARNGYGELFRNPPTKVALYMAQGDCCWTVPEYQHCFYPEQDRMGCGDDHLLPWTGDPSELDLNVFKQMVLESL